ncbi:MAG: hypothetical protein KDC98_15295 [Planctomycetes bacterium]|nr:hypothetical protein [Planctomycetota bacterium]
MAVLHGGHVPGFFDLLVDGTYLWDGTTWRLAGASCGNVPQPPLLVEQTLLVDPLRQRLLLVGGAYTPGGHDYEPTIWQWQGGCWGLLGVGAAVSLPMNETTYAYDAARDRIVAYRAALAGGETWEWDGTSWLQRLVPQPAWRRGGAMTYDVGRGRTVLCGGSGPSLPMRDTWEWDGNVWRQVMTATVPPDPYSRSFVHDPVAGRCLLFDRSTSDLWSYDGVAWTRLPNTTPPGFLEASFAYDPSRQRLLLYGGDRHGATFTSFTYEWDGARWQMVAPACLPGFESRAVTHDQRGTAMMLQGDAYTMVLWERGANGWDVVPVVGNLPPRGAFGFAYDAVRQQLVAFGGRSPALLDDTWIWSGASWTQMPSPVRPSPRQQPGMAFDTVNGGVLLFGGETATGVVNDTWLWNGAAWTSLAPATSPSPRTDPPMACDPGRGVIVLHGGLGPQQQALADTWEWNGTTWQNRVIAQGPVRQARSGIAFDPVRSVVVFCERRDRPVFSSWWGVAATWDWDGTAWLAHPESPVSIPMRGMPTDAFAYDPRVQLCVLAETASGRCLEFGGVQSLPVLNPLGGGCWTGREPRLLIGRPYLGSDEPIQVRSASLPSGPNPAFILAGLSHTTWNGLPLPLNLTGFGAPACWLQVAVDAVTFVGMLQSAQLSSAYWWQTCNCPQLLGVRISLQPVMWIPSINPAGWVLGDGLEVVPGLR